ncbi:hypothetical protein Tco_0689558, partial [Tanacetum coccineum]
MEKNKSFDVADYKRELYDALVKSYNTDKDIFESYGKVFLLKRSRDERDKDQDPSVGSDRGTKRRKSSKDAESSKDSKSKEKKSSSTSNDASQSQHKSSGKSAHVEEPSHTTWKSHVARAEEPPTSFDELNDTSFDFSAFVMNRLKIPNLTQEILEYLKGGDLTSRYPTLVTKTKAATYELKQIEDLVLKLWSPVEVKYNQHAYLGTSYWGPKCQSFYGYTSNLTSSKDVYSRRRIIAVTILKIMKKPEKGSGYGLGYRQAALSEEVDAKSREVCCWKDIRERSQSTGKDNMSLYHSHDPPKPGNLPRDIPLDSVVVLRYGKRSKCKNKGIVPTEMELLVLEQTQ